MRYEEIQCALTDFAEEVHTKDGWSVDDVLFCIEEFLERKIPVRVSAASINAEIHHKVTWDRCPICARILTEKDKEYRFGFCIPCHGKDQKGINLLKEIAKK